MNSPAVSGNQPLEVLIHDKRVSLQYFGLPVGAGSVGFGDAVPVGFGVADSPAVLFIAFGTVTVNCC